MDTMTTAQASLDSEDSGSDSDIWRPSGHAALLWLIGMAFLASTVIGQECRNIKLSESPQSLAWPVFINQQQTLLGIDGAGKQVVKIDLHDGRAGAVETRSFDGEKNVFVLFSPVDVSSEQGDVDTEIVQVYGDGPTLTVARFNQYLSRTGLLSFGGEDVKKVGPSQPQQSPGRRLVAPYQSVFTRGHFVGYGVVSSETEGQDYELGFFDQPLPSRGSDRIPPANLFHSFANPSFYMLGHPYVVSRGSEVLFLEMGRYPALYRFDLELAMPSEKISGLPGENRTLNDPMSHKLSLGDRASLMDRLDEFVGPWGLYQQLGEIYMLTRSLDGTAVDWRLHHLAIRDGRIDPEGSGVTVLPTQAQQIVLVPSPQDETWLLFEQTVGSDGQRRLTTLWECSLLSP